MLSLEEFELAPVREFNSYLEAHFRLTRYLLGYNVPSVGRLKDSREDRLPLLDSSLSTHLREVDRFLFNGGLQIDVPDASEEDPRQLLIDRVFRENKINNLLTQLWWSGAVYGELAVVYHRGSGSNLYPFSSYTADEFQPVYNDNRELVAIAICLLKEIKGKQYVFRQWVDSERFISYPLVELRQSNSFDWSAARQEQPHGWGLLPAAVIANHQDSHFSRGCPEFSQGALDKASELAIAYLDNASNHHQFATPIFISPDPDDTLKRLRARVQVLRKEAPEDGGDPHILAPQGMPASHFDLIDRLERSLANDLGRSYGNQDAPPDTSSLTLRLLNAKTISLAENRWTSYVDQGLLPLLGKVLIASAVDGIITGVSPFKPESYSLVARRLKPYFPASPVEKQQLLTVSSELIAQGIRREVALREYYPELTDEQILELMEGD